MDIQNFYVDSKRKISHPFRFLRSAVESTQKMSKPLTFPGVPVCDSLFEDQCFAHLENMTRSAPLSFPKMGKSDDGGPKKTYFGQYDRFPTIAFSNLVGGFVGSKSHSRASREPYQVWDVIFRQVVSLNGNLRHSFLGCMNCMNMRENISGTLIESFCPKHASGLDAGLTYLLASHCDIFEAQKHFSPESKHNYSNTTRLHEESCHLEIQADKSPSTKIGSSSNKASDMPRQSYADVAKSFVERGESSSEQKDCKKPSSCPLAQQNVKGSRVRTKQTKKIFSGFGSFLESSSSRNQYNNRGSHCSEKPVKMNREILFREKNGCLTKSYSDKCKTPGFQQHNTSVKSKRILEDRKPRNYKYKNCNMKEKERKHLGQQVQEDVLYLCNNAEETCKNWRCQHNRVKPASKFRVESQISTQKNGRNEIVDQNTTASQFVPGVDKIKLKDVPCIPVPEHHSHSSSMKVSKESDASICSGLSPIAIQETEGNVCRESSSSTSSSISTDNQTDRCRLVSESSVDSEDSVVFESVDCETPQNVNDIEEDSTDGECGSDSDSDCDLVDFCYLIGTSDVGDDPDLYVSKWLQDVNNKWREEHAMIPQKEKEPKKVHFAENKDLVKVHLLVKWDYAYRCARVGPWEEMARDRTRFKARIVRTESVLAPVLDPQHRRKVWEDRQFHSTIT